MEWGLRRGAIVSEDELCQRRRWAPRYCRMLDNSNEAIVAQSVRRQVQGDECHVLAEQRPDDEGIPQLKLF